MKRFGIIVSGGPAPGINSVISSAVIEASNLGYEVMGFRNGFRAASLGEPEAVVKLTSDNVSRIAKTGGSILGVSRFNPFSRKDTKDRFVSTLKDSSIDKLIVIGGEGSAYLSHLISTQVPDVHVAHVPKTIDNDLILPNNYPSFGFETARFAGTNILDTLMTDAKTCERWFLVTSMGRKAGFLALGLGIASGATLTLIPEEFFEQSPTPESIAKILFATMKRRIDSGKNYGLLLLAEGILDTLRNDSHELLAACPRDELGRIRYSQLELGDVIAPSLRAICKESGYDVRINTKNLGYELRCHDPVSFDIEYTKLLGLGAVEHLVSGHNGIMITRDFDHIGSQPLSGMLKEDGTIQSRVVDLKSDLYQAACRFMIR